MSKKVNVFWFRRDLRLDDNVGFVKALRGKFPVLPVFIFDSHILSELPEDDARVSFIYKHVQKLRTSLQEHGSSIAIYHGEPLQVFDEIIAQFEIQNVITNHDYEPYATERDEAVKELLGSENIGFYSFKDQVIFEKDEVVKDDGDPYVVYTPYMKSWRAKFNASKHLKEHDPSKLMDNLYQHSRLSNLSLSDMNFTLSDIDVPDYDVSPSLVNNYEKTRNFPATDGTSHLGPHLRFGTVSIRKMVKNAINSKNDVFWKELIWREFFMQILYHFPETVHNAFRKKYDRIPWRNNEKEFELWKQGKTGYPLVDAGMRQLNATGYMHNRVRMIVASFLCKHLLIDWRWGEAYFAIKLLDYEQASNVGNWQWASGSGVDAAPYFRIFNPTTQLEKFDKDKKYVKTWVEEFGTEAYDEEIVDHKEARERALYTYKEAIS
ncbi:MAG: DNA photolyase family protein [Bacteroidia bacterium]|nr:DNA photolyase family protein [Bacteroidia bacterium]NNF31333.1 deoxyribodipyrimidine photo-lyase [Flavobacteriaceae bacterium]MBT8276591.1 DNA photolyase family protein [Bacteroidia bacterium]NNJ82544.1 deoxyribodipyrimidine photo-lyase [Flavobacteriaceae bacterium]NNK54393.1 deoxyribodipyrimidine photo-lyase [Flavobacteriaceae bacterium]